MACSLSVVIPVYNEAASIGAHLARLCAYLSERFGDDYEIVAVDDGSQDPTANALLVASRDVPELRVVTHERNLGLDAAIRTGIDAAHGEDIVTFDADLTYAPSTIGVLVDALEQENADVALASPFLPTGECRGVPWMRRLFSVCANRFLSYALRGRFRTLTCVVRAYRAQVARALLEENPQLEVTFGLLFAAYRSGYRITEVPATLDWSQQPKQRTKRTSFSKLARRTWAIGIAGIRMRPITLLVIPGLIPALLPTVAAAAFFLGLSPARIAAATACTLAVQCASIAFASLLLAESLARDSAWKRVICSLSSSRTIRTIRGEASEQPSAMLSPPLSLREP